MRDCDWWRVIPIESSRGLCLIEQGLQQPKQVFAGNGLLCGGSPTGSSLQPIVSVGDKCEPCSTRILGVSKALTSVFLNKKQNATITFLNSCFLLFLSEDKLQYVNCHISSP